MARSSTRAGRRTRSGCAGRGRRCGSRRPRRGRSGRARAGSRLTPVPRTAPSRTTSRAERQLAGRRRSAPRARSPAGGSRVRSSLFIVDASAEERELQPVRQLETGVGGSERGRRRWRQRVRVRRSTGARDCSVTAETPRAIRTWPAQRCPTSTSSMYAAWARIGQLEGCPPGLEDRDAAVRRGHRRHLRHAEHIAVEPARSRRSPRRSGPVAARGRCVGHRDTSGSRATVCRYRQ